MHGTTKIHIFQKYLADFHDDFLIDMYAVKQNVFLVKITVNAKKNCT